MGVDERFICAILLIHIYVIYVTGHCPSEVPLEIDGECYKLQTDVAQYLKAVENCENLVENSKMVSRLSKTPKKLEKEMKDFIDSKLEKAYFWLGFSTKDTDPSTRLEDRKWEFEIDEKTVVQKEYEVWADPPTENGLNCAVINGSRQFDVVAVDCGGPRVPVVCMKKDDPCKDDNKPYLKFGDNCLLVLSAPLEYNKITGACGQDASPTPIKDKEMKKYVVNAVKNSFLGGGVFIDVKKWEGVYFFSDMSLVPKGMWGDGEPNQDHDCAGFFLQMDGSVKLRTLSCDAYASSLCHIKA